MHAAEAFVSLADFLRSRPASNGDAAAPISPLAVPSPILPSANPSETVLVSDPSLVPKPGAAEPAAVTTTASPQADVASRPAADRLDRPEDSEAPSSEAMPAGTAAIRQARLFSAALADALEMLVPELARALAFEVVGCELRLAPIDLETIARRLVAERLAQGPVRLRVAPADAHVTCDVPVVADPSLARGDAVLECRSGDIDARLPTRLAAVLRAVRA